MNRGVGLSLLIGVLYQSQNLLEKNAYSYMSVKVYNGCGANVDVLQRRRAVRGGC